GIPVHRLKMRRRTHKQPFIGKDVPEFLTIQGTTETLEVERGLPSDGSPSRVLLRTDAKNGYLTRGGGQLLMNDAPGLVVIQHPLNDGRIPLSVRRDPGESIPDEGVLLSVAMTRPGLSPLAVSLRFKLYDPQEGSKRLIEIQPGAAIGTASQPFIPQEFILREGYEVRWKNSDYDPHAFIIIDSEEDREVARFSKPIMPGHIGSWKPNREGVYQYHDTNNLDLIGLIHVLPRKEEHETSANPPAIIYVTQDGRTVDGRSTRSWAQDGGWSDNNVVKLNKPGSVKSMTINLDYVGFVEYRDNMKPKDIPKLHVVIGRDFVTLICAADQTLYRYYKDRDVLPDEYDAIIDSSARGIAEVLPTLMLEVRDSDMLAEG
ncbi:MAG: cupredoxin domain-containing protein, partial [Nitrososphaerales archaeon]